VTYAALLYGALFLRWDPRYINDDPRTKAVDGFLAIDGIANERDVYTLLSGDHQPVTYHDYIPYVDPPLKLLEPLPRARELVDVGGSKRVAPADRPVLVAGSIGLVGYRYRGTTLVDQLSLADPVGAHMQPGPPGRPGHEKIMGWDWVLARYADPTAGDPPTTVAARAALRCGRLKDLVEAVDDPLTPGRFLENLTGAMGRTSLRIPTLPQQADAAFC
jgi:arabinofuranosyltransferase